MRKNNPGLGDNSPLYSPTIASIRLGANLDGILREDATLPWERGPWLRQYIKRIERQHQTLYARSVTQSPANEDAGVLAAIEVALQGVTPAPNTDPVVSNFMASHVTPKGWRKGGKMAKPKEAPKLTEKERRERQRASNKKFQDAHKSVHVWFENKEHEALTAIAKEKDLPIGVLVRDAVSKELGLSQVSRKKGRGWKLHDRRASANR